jgi:hypothetical protein
VAEFEGRKGVSLGSVGSAGNVVRAGSARDMRIAGPDGGVGCGGRDGVDDEVSSGWREGEDGRGCSSRRESDRTVCSCLRSYGVVNGRIGFGKGGWRRKRVFSRGNKAVHCLICARFGTGC